MTLPEQCRAAVFSGADKPLHVRSFPLPLLREGETLVRVTCCTICGSDVHTFQGRRVTPTPTILGHEILGEVAALPEQGAVQDIAGRPLNVGDRVTWSIAASCGQCFFCARGLPQKCEDLFKYGHEKIGEKHPLSGGLAEYCHLAPGTAIVRVPAEVPDAVACPANCATATVAAALRVGGYCEDEVVLIQGAGMLGLTACAMASAGGAREVIACDVDAKRLERASRFGATQCVRVADETALKPVVDKATEGRGVDLAVELSGANSAVEAALGSLRIGGRLVLVGTVFPGPDVAVSPETVVRRLLNIHGLHNYTPQDLAAAVSFLTEHHIDFPFADLAGAVFALEEVETAFQHASESGALRVMVRFEGSG